MCARPETDEECAERLRKSVDYGTRTLVRDAENLGAVVERQNIMHRAMTYDQWKAAHPGEELSDGWLIIRSIGVKAREGTAADACISEGEYNLLVRRLVWWTSKCQLTERGMMERDIIGVMGPEPKE